MGAIDSQSSLQAIPPHGEWATGTGSSSTVVGAILARRRKPSEPPPLPLPPGAKDGWRIDGPPPVCEAALAGAFPKFEEPAALARLHDPRLRRQAWREERLRELRCWLASFVVHLVVLLLLAVAVTAVVLPASSVHLIFIAEPQDEILTEEQPEETASFELEESSADEPEEPQEVDSLVLAPQEEIGLDQVLDDETAQANAALPGGGMQGEFGEGVGLHGASGTGGGAVSFMGISDDFNSVVYVIDASGSMRGSKFDRAREELLRSLESLGAERSFSISIFNDGPNHFSSVLLPGTRENVERARAWMYTLQADGSTIPQGSMSWALSLEPDAIFLLSDSDVYSAENTNAILEIMSQQRRGGTVVHTSSYDKRESAIEWSEPWMRKIASLSGGSLSFPFAERDAAQQLADALERAGLPNEGANLGLARELQSETPERLVERLMEDDPVAAQLAMSFAQDRSGSMAEPHREAFLEPLFAHLAGDDPQMSALARDTLTLLYPADCYDLATCGLDLEPANFARCQELREASELRLAEAIAGNNGDERNLGLRLATGRAQQLNSAASMNLGRCALPLLQDDEPRTRELAHGALAALGGRQRVLPGEMPVDDEAARAEQWVAYWDYLQRVQHYRGASTEELLEQIEQGEEGAAAAAALVLAEEYPIMSQAERHALGVKMTEWLSAAETGYARESHRLGLTRLAPTALESPEFESWEKYWEEDGRRLADMRSAAMLSQAASLRQARRFEMARDLYEEVLREYPGTEAAETAQRMLEDDTLWRRAGAL